MKTNSTNRSRKDAPEGAVYLNNVPFCHGEITVVASRDAEASMKHSARLAATSQKAGVSTMIVNCGMSSRRFGDHLSKVRDWKVKKQQLLVHHATRWDLFEETEAMWDVMASCKVGVVIIVGWEWAADSYRRRQRILRFLREMMEEDIAVIIYAHTNTRPQAGKLDRNLGKLALVARYVAKIEAVEELEEVAPKEKPIVVQNPQDLKDAEVWVDELVRNVNGIRVSDSDDPETAFALAA